MAELNLRLLGQKVLQQPVQPELLAYCPSMDLLAVCTTKNDIHIYRLNGQLVHTISQRDRSLQTQKLTWRANGQLLAVAWSNGSVSLYATETSKTVHQVEVISPDSADKITCLGWASNSTLKSTESAKVNDSPSSWKDLLEDHDDLTILDLPRDLSLIDIESSLPKLSAIPSGDASEDLFSTRASLDAIFRPFDPKDNDAVDIMLVGTQDGHLHLSIYDSFIIGTFDLPEDKTRPSLTSPRVMMHSAHKSCSTHSLLVQRHETLYLVPMDLRFVSSSNGYLSLLASKSTTLQNLLRYVNSVQGLMVTEWKASRDLPGRFLANIDETLIEKCQMNIVDAMYHSVATGHTFPEVREWLVDELAERGHKRWEKAVMTGLEGVRRLVHEHLMPALERCTLILSRLSGIARYQEKNGSIGYSNHQIKLVMDTVLCLNVVAANILSLVVEELDLFISFSGWLRHEIDRLASSSSAAADDAALEKEAAIDHAKVLRYIEDCMTQSQMAVYFQEPSKDDLGAGQKILDQSTPVVDILDKQLRKQEAGQEYLRALPNITFLADHLTRQSNAIFHQIAEAEKRNVLLGRPIELQAPASDCMKAMRMCSKSPSCCSCIVAFATTNGEVTVHTTELTITNGISKVTSTEVLRRKLNNLASKIVDIAFLDDLTLLVLHCTENKYAIESINAQSVDEMDQQPNHTADIPGDAGFEPAKMKVREGKVAKDGTSTSRLCLVNHGGTAFRVFSL